MLINPLKLTQKQMVFVLAKTKKENLLFQRQRKSKSKQKRTKKRSKESKQRWRLKRKWP
jgi:hypothetical protein